MGMVPNNIERKKSETQQLQELNLSKLNKFPKMIHLSSNLLEADKIWSSNYYYNLCIWIFAAAILQLLYYYYYYVYALGIIAAAMLM